MDHPSLTDILSHTPRWVFAVFLLLLALGYQQSRDRTVSRTRLLFLPTAMLVLSLAGVASSFGGTWLSLLAWALGLATTALPGLRPALAATRRPTSSGPVFVPGSWWPLVLMLAIFGLRYVTGYAQARKLDMTLQPWVIGAISLSLGLISGAFLARAGAALRARR